MQRTMDDKCRLTFQQRSMVQQGYGDFTPQQLKEMEWGLRFTPTLCALITFAGLLLQQPAILFAVAALGVWAFLFPASHPIEETQAKRFFQQGAAIVDVRSPQEFAQGHLEAAVNIPLDTLPQAADRLPDGVKLLHCKSGMRSQTATKLLKQHGVTDVHNIGSFSRAQRIAGESP